MLQFETSAPYKIIDLLDDLIIINTFVRFFSVFVIYNDVTRQILYGQIRGKKDSYTLRILIFWGVFN